MSGRFIRLTLPMPTNRGNARQHWAVTLKGKKAYMVECDDRQNAGLIPPPPATAFERCVINATMYLGNHMDDDNAMARLKFVLDWIRTRGYVRDDSRKVIQWAGFPRQIVDRVNAPRVEIALTEITVL